MSVRAPRAPLPVGRATLAVLLAAMSFATISIATVVATRAGTPLATVITGRFALTALLLAALARGRGGLRAPGSTVPRLLLVGGGMQALINVLNLSALAYLPAATTVFLFYTYPAWVAVLAALRGTERVDAGRVAALLLALAGIVILVGAPGSVALPAAGVALSLAGAFCYAVYIPILHDFEARTSAAATTFHVAVGVTVLMGVGALWRGELRVPPAAGWGAIAWLAVVPTVVAFQAFLRGLATLGPVRTAILSCAEPFAAALFGALVLGQPITTGTMAGGGCIAAAVLLLQRRAG